MIPAAAFAVLASLYFGTTLADGAHHAGTVFEWAPGHGPETIYDFCSQRDCADGKRPETNVIPVSDDFLVGTASKGGKGAGTIWTLLRVGDVWQEQTYFAFCNYWDHCDHFGGPVGTLSFIENARGTETLVGTCEKLNGRGCLWSYDGRVFAVHHWFKH